MGQVDNKMAQLKGVKRAAGMLQGTEGKVSQRRVSLGSRLDLALLSEGGNVTTSVEKISVFRFSGPSTVHALSTDGFQASPRLCHVVVLKAILRLSPVAAHAVTYLLSQFLQNLLTSRLRPSLIAFPFNRAVSSGGFTVFQQH